MKKATIMASFTKTWLSIAGVVLFSGMWAPNLGSAQTGQGRITGYVHDQKDAAVAGAKVVIVSSLTGESHATVTLDNGTFAFPLLPPSTYDVTASAEGFRPEKNTGIQLTASAIINVDLTLRVGTVSESVMVRADSELVTTQGAAIGETLNEQAIVELPLNGRNPASLVNLTPGAIDVVNTTSAGWNQTYTNFPSGTAAIVGGQRQGTMFYSLDGGDANDTWGGLAAPMPNPDATQQFKVTSANPDADSGFSSGGSVSIVTKSGTNHWHGDVFEFLRDGSFNSKGWFSTAKDQLHRNQFGGSIGGPIVRDRLFIFLNYQGTINHQTINGGSVNIPNANAVAGTFGYLCSSGFDANGVCMDRTGTGPGCVSGSTPSPNCVIQNQLYANLAATQSNNGTNVIPYNLIGPGTSFPFNPVALNIEALFPTAPNNLQGEISTAGLLNVFNYEEGTARVDYLPNSVNRISFRSFVDNYNNPPTGTNVLEETRSWPIQFQSHTGTWTWTVRQNLLNNFVFGYNRDNSNSTSGYSTNITKLGATGIATDSTYPTSLGVETNGFCLCENFNGFDRHTYNFTDSITYTKGKHLVVAGVDVLRQYQYGGTDWGAVPIINFDGSQTGNWMADFLLGDVQSYDQSGGGFALEYQNYYSAYATDTIRLRPNFSVNVGLRWEPFMARTTSENKVGAWRPGEQSQRFPNAPLGEVYPGDPGIPAGTVPNRYDIFSPRIAIAWQPRFLYQTSVRAGFGLYAVPANGTLNPGVDDQPFTPNVGFTANQTTTGVISLTNPWADYAPTGGTSPFPPFATPSWNPPQDALFLPTAYFGGFAPNYTSGKNEAWNLSVERQIGSNMLAKVAYVGNHSYDLAIIQDLNPGQFVCAPIGPNCSQAQYNLNGVRTIPYIQSLPSAGPAAVSSYDSLQLSFDKKFSRGLLFSVNYTWSKALDEQSYSHFDGNASFSDPFDIRHDYGISDLNFPRLFNMYWVYQTPGLRGMNQVLRGFLATWQVSGIWHMQSGQPFSVISGVNNSFSNEGLDRADFVSGQTTTLGAEKNVVVPGTNYIPYFSNAGAFQENAFGTFGNTPRNLYQAQGSNNWDLGFGKNFQMTERCRLQLRVEAFNAFNRTQFGVPYANVSSGPVSEGGFFGVLYYLQNAPRVIQFSGKLYF
jgi:Carboxypeptidase regulatory-like domain